MASKANVPRVLLTRVLIFVMLEVSKAAGFIPGTGASDQCEYKFTVRAPVDCSITDSDLKNTVSLMKQDIDMTRLSTVSINSAIQVRRKGNIIVLRIYRLNDTRPFRRSCSIHLGYTAALSDSLKLKK
ncbi:hypothetical protein ElyMa_001955100 [Elysia marginata]|uniref:Uncharacterized protein n=1 Tax=Elysia marginata TaxID=1093978 RepID=A0AAV4EYM0_9GAST|nr:hypothetical protein ElyMa_001955100 [Elysia marginata]